MSYDIPVSFVEQFRDNVYVLAQQKGSKLASGVRQEMVTGKSAYFERMGPTEAVQRTSRHADTPLVSTPHSRRKVSLADWEWADLVDDQDQVRLLIEPTNPYAMNAAAAMGRTMDDEIVEGIRGPSFAGETGGTTVNLPASQRLTEGGTAGLTLEKIVQSRTKLLAADVDPDVTPFHFAVHPNQLQEMLTQEKLTSADYNSVRALVSGDPVVANGFMGFNWHITTRVPYKEGSSTLRDTLVWAQDGICCAKGKEVNVKITERPDKSYATQVYACMTIGATRIEEDKVVVVESHDA